MSKKGPVVDEKTLVAESWAELAHSSDKAYSPYQEYQLAKQRGQDNRDKKRAYKPIRNQATSAAQVETEVASQPAATQEDCQKVGSFNTHHQRAIIKLK